VTDQGGALPQRIGDRERDQAAEYLREHMAEGRLDQEEFDERLTSALTARTQADLDPLFLDLPSPKPGTVAAPTGFGQPMVSRELTPRPPYPVRMQSRSTTALAVASALIWPAMIVLIIASHGHLMFLMFLPFLLPWILGRRDPRRR
jgi:hypothetical protein